MDVTEAILRSYIPVCDALAKMIGPHCEVLIHDLTHPLHSIFYIVNGHLSGREEGDSVGPLFKEFIQTAQNNHDMLVNYYYFEQGKPFKDTKVLIRDGDGRAIGCLCVNIMIEEYLQALDVLQRFCDTVPLQHYGEQASNDEKNDDLNISRMVKDFIANACMELRKTTDKPTKEERKEMVRFLEEKGIFCVKGAVDWVAEAMEISRFTVYNYLDQIRNPEEEETGLEED
jgi:predicted transcriptional regulator YheO